VKWERLGHRFAPDGRARWARSHASTPWGTQRHNGLLRVHYSSRDEHNRSHIAWVDLDPTRSFEPVEAARQPTLQPGRPGLFDDSGVSVGCLVEAEGRDLLYYLGWNLRTTVPWTNTIGLAVRVHGDETFVKHGAVPVMDRSEEDPFSLSYPCVLSTDQGYTMWYGTNDEWGQTPESMVHSIARATSSDGINWARDADRALRPERPHESAISRPSVRRTGTGYEMFYSHRGSSSAAKYRIGWATSPDGLTWERRDGEIGLDVASSGWDSEMICYPFVFDHGADTYMIYNGNGFGRSGFGIARLAER
jgi:hypothetical protein